MIEEFGDLWELDAEARCVTTNGYVRRDGAAVMGRGVALQCKQRYPGIEYDVGRQIKKNGNHVSIIGRHRITEGWALVIFPVKHHWAEIADVELIKRSAQELANLIAVTRWKRVLLPRPGCGSGQLSWDVVRPVIESLLDDRVVVVNWRQE